MKNHITRLNASLINHYVLAVLISMGASTSYATTVIYNDRVIEISDTLPDANDLWIKPSDLTRINGFELKPEGACREEICIPILQNKDTDIIITRDQQTWFSTTAFAKKLGQSYVADHDTGVWSFGAIPLEREAFLNSAVAPNFSLKDRNGKTIKLSGYRGKKVFLTTWASWCGCRLDVPVWEKIYQQVKDKNVEFIVVAQDTGGEAAAGKYYDEVKPSYTAIIDEHHTISSLYNFVNVPSAAWIDEQGRIVRINEGTYAQSHGPIGTDDYTPTLLDWIDKGAKSQYVWDADKVSAKIIARTPEQDKAEPAFKLGNYFHAKGTLDKADAYWGMAQELSPDNINYFREELSYTEEGSMGATYRSKRVEMREAGKDYYRSLDLEE